MFGLPITIRKGLPPDPDFVFEYGSTAALIEITEATEETDQREMTKSEQAAECTLLGEYGGRFSDGAVGDGPERAWIEDVLAAMRRKKGKVIFLPSLSPRHLVIHPNSNASFLLLGREGEREAIDMLEAELAKHRDDLTNVTNGCVIHILGDNHVCLDLLGRINPVVLR